MTESLLAWHVDGLVLQNVVHKGQESTIVADNELWTVQCAVEPNKIPSLRRVDMGPLRLDLIPFVSTSSSTQTSPNMKNINNNEKSNDTDHPHHIPCAVDVVPHEIQDVLKKYPDTSLLYLYQVFPFELQPMSQRDPTSLKMSAGGQLIEIKAKDKNTIRFNEDTVPCRRYWGLLRWTSR